MPTVITSSVYFELDDVPSATPGWKCRNPLELFRPPQKRSTEGTIIPGAHWRLPNDLWDDATTYILDWIVWGQFDHEGDAHSNAAVGIETNLAYLHDNVIAVPDSGSTRECVLHLPSGDTMTGEAQVISFTYTINGANVVTDGVMELYLPAGLVLDVTP